MSFGVVQSAISSVKYCKSLLSKRGRLKNTLSSNTEGVKFELKSPKASKYQLKILKEKLKEENKNIRVKQYLALAIVMFVLLIIFLYLIH